MIEFFDTPIPVWLMLVLIIAMAGNAVCFLIQFYIDSRGDSSDEK